MQVTKIDLKDANSFSPFFIDYLENKPELKPFFGHAPTLGNFEKQIESKVFSDEKRQVLCQVLRDQYLNTELSNEVEKSLTQLADAKTYTVTTGHQLNICTGPLYFIYKIVTVVNACRDLKKKYPNYNFVPVYWMASEDHDFEEISYFHLFGKKYEWQTDEKGAVGRMSTAGLSQVLEELPESVALFEKAYGENDNLADAVRYYVNELFGEQGVVVIDGDEPRLKAEFAEVIKDDLLQHHAHAAVEKTNEKLSSLGYKTQVFPREINFFYLDSNLRERIIKEDGLYKVLNTELVFSENELIDLVDMSPEKFSPNVVMRPLYEETILPNLAYTGGPGELIYWLQLKDVFEHYETVFPVLLPRNFGLVIDGASEKKLSKFSFSDLEIFKSTNDLQAAYLASHGQDEMNLNGEFDELKKVYDELAEKAAVIDGSLKGFIAAEHSKAHKGIENIEKRLKKSEERKHETALNQIASSKERLFPSGGLQERQANFLNFYINNPNFVDQLLENLDAFDLRMHILRN